MGNLPNRLVLYEESSRKKLYNGSKSYKSLMSFENFVVKRGDMKELEFGQLCF